MSNKWGTKQPVMTRDPELGPVRLRVFGTYAVHVSDAEAFVRELVGSNSSYTIGQISDQLRDLVVARFSELLGENTEDYKTYKLDYHGGEKFPHLVRDETKPDVLSEIIKPR